MATFDSRSIRSIGSEKDDALGSVKTICWTDHANLTKAQHTDVGADVKLVRWVAEILSDGSEIRSLSGRSAKLGDGFSRNPKERDQLLQNRTKDLEGLAGQLKGFNLDEYLGEGVENSDGPIAWGVGDDAVPSSCGGATGSVRRAESIGAVGELLEVKVLFVADYTSHLETSRAVSKLRSLFAYSMPDWKVTVHVVYGAFEDDHELNAHVDGATARLSGERRRTSGEKDARRLTDVVRYGSPRDRRPSS